MKLKVPQEVRSAIKDVDLASFARTRQKLKARENERKRQERIDALRLKWREDLAAAAAFVFAWRDAYADTQEARRICELAGPKTPITIFGAGFWQGEPTDDRHAWATLSIADGPLVYEERYNHVMGSSAPVRTIIVDPAGLVAAVHPDFLSACESHLKGPDAWKFILRQLADLRKSFG